MGVAFVDSLIEHSDADVVIVERRHRAGGHWLDSYPFVQLHQPSATYGVNSTRLGLDRIEREGSEAGFYERASGTEICGYYDEIMRHRLIASGRVRFFPMCDYLGDRRFRSLLNGDVTDVTVRRRVVDATYMATRVPRVRTAAVRRRRRRAVRSRGRADEGRARARRLRHRRRGKDRARRDLLAPRSRDAGRRHHVDPPTRLLAVESHGSSSPATCVMETFEGIVLELEAVAECDSVEEVYERLEARDVVFRVDRSVVPTMMKGATLSAGELAQLRLRRQRRAPRARRAHRPRRDRARARHDRDQPRTSARALRDARTERPPAGADLHGRHRSRCRCCHASACACRRQ